MLVFIYKEICNVLLWFPFNSIELSHSCKTSWASESQWGSCKKDPAKGQVRTARVCTGPVPVATVAGEGAWLSVCSRGQRLRRAGERALSLPGSTRRNIRKGNHLHLKENQELHSCFFCSTGTGAFREEATADLKYCQKEHLKQRSWPSCSLVLHSSPSPPFPPYFLWSWPSQKSAGQGTDLVNSKRACGS